MGKIVIAMLLICLPSLQSYSEENKPTTQQNKKATELQGCYEEWIPYIHKVNGKTTGIAVEIVETALKNIGYTVKWLDITPARCYERVENGAVDFTLNVSMEDGRKWIHSQTVIVDWELRVIVGKNSAFKKFTTLDEFKDKKLALTKAYVYPEEISKHFDKFKLEYLTEAPQGIKMVDSGRADFIIEDPLWAKFMSQQFKLNVRDLQPTVLVDPTYVVFAPKNKSTAKLYDREIISLAKSGYIDSVYSRIAGSEYQNTKRIINTKLDNK